MIKEILWTNMAREDLQDVFDLLADQSVDAAQNLMDSILHKTEMLKKSYQSFGQKDPHLDDPYFFFIEGNFKILYKVEEQSIIILTVFDSRTNP